MLKKDKPNGEIECRAVYVNLTTKVMINYKFSLKNAFQEILRRIWYTDSLAYEIKSEDFYEEFFKYKHFVDFSNYPKDSKFFVETNKKLLVKQKMILK